MNDDLTNSLAARVHDHAEQIPGYYIWKRNQLVQGMQAHALPFAKTQ